MTASKIVIYRGVVKARRLSVLACLPLLAWPALSQPFTGAAGQGSASLAAKRGQCAGGRAECDCRRAQVERQRQDAARRAGEGYLAIQGHLGDCLSKPPLSGAAFVYQR